MARTKAELSTGARLADYLTVGYLALNCPVEKVRAVLVAHGAQSKRKRGLPHEVLVYFVMAMVLYADVAYEEVLRLVVEGLRQLLGDEGVAKATVTKGAISQAREQVGAAPLRDLYQEQVRPHGPADMPGVCYRGLRLMAIDGSTLDMPDEAANAGTFGYPAASRGESAFPQLRFVALAECGTHTLCFASHGPYKTGELTLAEAVIDQADASMVVTADRNFFGFPFWQRACKTGAKLLFRVKKNLRLPCERSLADGSYLTTLYPSDTDRRHQTNGTVVRVVEYQLDGIPDPEPAYRLITNWLEAEAAPAVELAALYHRRWTIEQTFDEFKVHLADRAVVLRSKRPELVEQEFYALLIAHAAIRRLMTEAAARTAQSSEDLSFIHAVRVLKRRLPAASAIPP
ncbi:IS4 family transposase [Ferrovum sp.]|uniref:IS4 family transposase n=1 Tax=Ferrovum sp. TaxID=2609467 RepID=UPI002624C6A4|nr:IS4 family transposase [Ferrovum sp.]